MSDLISRKAALEALNGRRQWHSGVSSIWINLLDAIGEIERVPVVEPVRYGTWELVPVGVNGHITVYHGCSACGCVFKSPSHYCPNCGAKMDDDDT